MVYNMSQDRNWKGIKKSCYKMNMYQIVYDLVNNGMDITKAIDTLPIANLTFYRNISKDQKLKLKKLKMSK